MTGSQRAPRLVITAWLAASMAIAGFAVAQGIRTTVIWKEVTPGGWRWLEDYVFLKATYVLGCPRDRKCRVGSGMMIGGEPRGQEKEFSGDIELTVYGIGALHLKVADSVATPVRVGFYRREQMLVPVYPPPGS